jgi:hypothetical protein
MIAQEAISANNKKNKIKMSMNNFKALTDQSNII